MNVGHDGCNLTEELLSQVVVLCLLSCLPACPPPSPPSAGQAEEFAWSHGDQVD